MLVLSWLRGPAVERALTRMLGQSTIRAEVIEALVRQGAPVVPQLIEQLRTEDAETRLAAIVALGRLADRRATEALVGLLGRSRDLTVAAAGALAELGDPAAFEPLLRLLGDKDVAVRQAAIGALNSLGHPEMSRRVVVLLNDDNPHVRGIGGQDRWLFRIPRIDRRHARALFRSDRRRAARRARTASALR